VSERTRLTLHARERADEMGLDHHAVIKVAKRPEMIWPSLSYPGCEMRRIGDVVVATAEDGRVIITVLWWAPEAPHVRQAAS
jgi:hypothetical protein